MSVKLQGKSISLETYTSERCHEFWSKYISDYDMWDFDYIYDKEKVDKYFESKATDKSRRFFAICNNKKTVGEIQLKGIDLKNKCGTLSIHFSCDAYKNRGWGTQAIQLIIKYAFDELKLKRIYADAVHRNTKANTFLKRMGLAICTMMKSCVIMN